MSDQQKRKFNPEDGVVWEVMKGPQFPVTDEPPKYGIMLRPVSRRTGRNITWHVYPPKPSPKRPPLPPLPLV